MFMHFLFFANEFIKKYLHKFLFWHFPSLLIHILSMYYFLFGLESFQKPEEQLGLSASDKECDGDFISGV